MSALRLTCTVSAIRDGDMPQEESHPFWEGLEELAEAVAQFARDRGLDPNELGYWEDSEEGTLLVQSSDAPRDVCRFWVYLPHDPALQAKLLPDLLERLADMREALPDAHWTVELGDEPLHWDSGRFHLRS